MADLESYNELWDLSDVSKATSTVLVQALLKSYAAAGYAVVDAKWLTLAVSDSAYAKQYVAEVKRRIDKPNVKGVLITCCDFGHTCGWLCSKKSFKHLELFPSAVSVAWVFGIALT